MVTNMTTFGKIRKGGRRREIDAMNNTHTHISLSICLSIYSHRLNRLYTWKKAKEIKEEEKLEGSFISFLHLPLDPAWNPLLFLSFCLNQVSHFLSLFESFFLCIFLFVSDSHKISLSRPFSLSLSFPPHTLSFSSLSLRGSLLPFKHLSLSFFIHLNIYLYYFLFLKLSSLAPSFPI